jgi:cytochrome P450
VADVDYRILSRHAERLLNSAWMAENPEKYRDYLAEVEDFFNGYIDARLATLEQAGVTEPGREHVGTLLPDDVISDLVCGKVMDRRLTRPEMLALLQVLLVGGYETSTFMITNCVWRLLEDRSRWEAVKAEPDRLIPIAIEESLRFDPPGLGLWRTTACPVAKHGEVIPEHHKVQMSYGSANRDPAMFEDGDSFRLDRPLGQARKHLTFGAGPHMCVGQHLARMDMAVALRALMRGLPDLRLDGPTERVVNFGFWGRKKLPLAW